MTSICTKMYKVVQIHFSNKRYFSIYTIYMWSNFFWSRFQACMADIYPLYDIKYLEALGEKLSHSIFDRSRNTKSCSTSSLVIESMVVSFLGLGFEVGVTCIHMHIEVGVTCIHMRIEERRRESRGGKSDVGNGWWDPPPPPTPQADSKSGEAQE